MLTEPYNICQQLSWENLQYTDVQMLCCSTSSHLFSATLPKKNKALFDYACSLRVNQFH